MEDSSPERRNLMVTSLAFIAYFYAGGSFPEAQVHLQVINANFSRPEVLAVIAWAGFFWFVYRYWEANSREIIRMYIINLSPWHRKDFVKKYLNRSLENILKENATEGYEPQQMLWKNGHVVVPFNYLNGVIWNSEGQIQSHLTPQPALHPSKEVEFTNIRGWLIALRVIVRCAFQEPTLSDFIVPYFLAVAAIIGGLVRVVC